MSYNAKGDFLVILLKCHDEKKNETKSDKMQYGHCKINCHYYQINLIKQLV